MSLYIDTSCLLKLFLMEPESARVEELFSMEEQVVVSSLVRLEALQSLQALRLGGAMNPAQYRRLVKQLEDMLQLPPFAAIAFPPPAIELAEKQSRRGAYCRTLDSLHLGAMEALGLDRLLTNDSQQAAAARALGFTVLLPR